MKDRPLFDPSRVRVPDSDKLRQPPREAANILTPHQVNEMLRGAVAAHFPTTLHVLGEIGDLSRPGSGHLYFSLKDADSELRCVMWRGAAAKLKFNLETGLEVIATGGMEVYTPRGTVQLIVRRIEPRGAGALELAFRQLKQKLADEGLFDPARKRPLPPFPRRVALITSPRGAAIRDMLDTMRRRFPICEILVLPVRVQGDEAAPEIAAAMANLPRAAELAGPIDAVIVGRGGGSLEDLWAFNEEIVARAIAACPIPVISAVGHEVDFSICDFVADVRAATPTAAAELVTPDQRDLLDRVGNRARRAQSAITQQLALARRNLLALQTADPLARPHRPIQQRAQRLDEIQLQLRAAWTERLRETRTALNQLELGIVRFAAGATFARLERAVDQRLLRLSDAIAARLRNAAASVEQHSRRAERALPIRRLERLDERLAQTAARITRIAARQIRDRRAALNARAAQLEAIDPQAVVRRGYSITRLAGSRKIVRSTADIKDHARIVIEVADGEFRATADDPRQPGLFDE